MEEEFFCFCSGEQNEKGSVIVFVNEGGGTYIIRVIKRRNRN